jgi:hypothetical protein
MNRCDVLIAKLNRDLESASPGFQYAAISSRPCYFLRTIFLGVPVTFLFWHTYSVVKLTLNGESISAARGLMEKKSKRNVAGEWKNDE